MQNITIAGASYSDVPAVDIAKTGGGLARFTDVTGTTALAEDVANGKIFYAADGSESLGSFLWDFKGYKPELMNNNLYSFSSTLANTDFNTWTPSTTASIIVASTNLPVFSADMATYEYLVHWLYTFDAVYPEGTTLKAAPIREVGDLWQTICKRPSNLANIQTSTFNGNACITLNSTPLNVYRNTSGTLTSTYSLSYGVYPAVVAATFSSSTSNTPNVTIKTPSISARCNSSYFSTAMAEVIDKTNSVVKLKGELWRVQVGAVTKSLYEKLIYLYNNPLT